MFVQSIPWKEKMLFLMGITGNEKTLSQNVPWLLLERVTVCLQCRMVDGVHQADWLRRRSTSMADRLLVGQMMKVDPGPIRFIH